MNPTTDDTVTVHERCRYCEYSKDHGWWGPPLAELLGRPGGTHCIRCHRSWMSLTEAHCTLCCEHFSTHRTADRHRVGRGDRCGNPATMCRPDGQPLFRKREAPLGVTWLLVAERPPERLRCAAGLL